MTEEYLNLKILHLAWTQQINIWAKENDLYQQDPTNEFQEARTKMAWELLEQIGSKMREAERKTL